MTDLDPDKREEMRRQMMLNANEEAAASKERVQELQKQVNLLERENSQLSRDAQFYRDIIKRMIHD